MLPELVEESMFVLWTFYESCNDLIQVHCNVKGNHWTLLLKHSKNNHFETF